MLMKKLTGKICMVIAAIYCCNFAAGNDSLNGVDLYPREERLRPMILPKKMWQVSNGIDLYVWKNDNGTWKPRIDHALFGIAPRRSLSRRIEIPRFPWLPYMRILLTEADIGTRADGTLNRLAVVFDGGLSGLSISGDGSFWLNLIAGVHMKYLLGERWWYEQCLSVTGSQSNISNNSSCILYEMLGCQFTKTVALTTGISGGLSEFSFDNHQPRILGSLKSHLLVNFSKRFNLDLGGTLWGGKVLDGSKVRFSGAVSPRLTIQW